MIDLGQGFTPRFGRYIEQMPALRAAGEIPISMDIALEMQLQYPDTWGSTYIYTGDAAYTGTTGGVVIDINSPLLLAVNSDTKFCNRAQVLSADQWEERRYNRDTFYLSAEEVEEANGKGYVKRNGVWQPENSVVGWVWDILGRGKYLRDNAELASQKSNGAQRVLDLCFYQGRRSDSTGRAWCLDNLNDGSFAHGSDIPYNANGHLVGNQALQFAARTRE